MGKGNIFERLKDLVYSMILPIFLWSVGFRTMEDYWRAIEEELKITGKKPT